MINSNDVDYFRARAEEERELSETTADPAIALIHSKLAQRYRRLVASESAGRPTLSIAVPVQEYSLS